MRSLVVWAHPRPESFSKAALDTTVGALQRAGHHVDVIDLYGSCYRSTMSEREWLAYRDLRADPDEVSAAHIALVRAAEQLVFVYPTWWFGVPAALKGWLERTMVPGVAFDLDQQGRVRGGLVALRRIVGVATYGSAPWYVHLIGDAGRRTLARTLRMSAPKPWRVRVSWLALYRLDTTTEAQRQAFLERIDRKLGGAPNEARGAADR